MINKDCSFLWPPFCIDIFCFINNQKILTLKKDKVVKSLSTRHCEERSDEAISKIQLLALTEIASLRSQ